MTVLFSEKKKKICHCLLLLPSLLLFGGYSGFNFRPVFCYTLMIGKDNRMFSVKYEDKDNISSLLAWSLGLCIWHCSTSSQDSRDSMFRFGLTTV